MSMEFDTSEVDAKLAELERDAPNIFAAALYQNAQDIIRVAVPKVPVDTGRLRGAWVVDAPKMQSGRIFVVIGFGTEYAIYVHERTDLSHAVGEAKFLESAIKEEAAGFAEKLADRGYRMLKSGGPGIAPKRESGSDYSGGVT